MKDHNPIEDELKQYSLEEFIETAKAELDKYQEEFKGANDFQKGKHTWNEWPAAFARYMSW